MQLLDLQPGRLTAYGRELAEGLPVTDRAFRSKGRKMSRAEWFMWLLSDRGGSIGNAVENKILDHITGQTSYTMPTPYLGLWTGTVDDSSTAATANEANYTTYARQAISGTNMSAAASGAVTNDVAITFPAVTAGDDTITFWMLCSSSSGAGDNIAWGTCTSTVVDTTHTPPTVDIGALDITLD
jgi:hypothetical protein